MNEDSTFDNVFPRVHRNDVTEAESKVALFAALPRDKFVLHEESVDRGVDYSIEVVDDGFDKNYRAQVQLKGTDSLEPLQDGTYSLAVATSNVNHLLNNPISLYFLYIKSKPEIRFVWTWDERVRIEAKNKDWIKQDTTTLRFVEVLNDVTLEEIRQRIMAHGKGIRKINENVFFADSENVIFEIDPKTFEVTDLKELREIIGSKGIGLCILGAADWVLEKIRLFTKQERQSCEIRIVEVIAHFEKGNYQRAKECIARLRSEYPNLKPENRVLLDFVKIHSDFEVGQIDHLELVERLRVLCEEQVGSVPYNIRFSYLQKAIWTVDDEEKRFSGSNERKRWEMFAEINNYIDPTRALESETEIGKRNLFSVLKLESELIATEYSARIGRELMGTALGIGNLGSAVSKYMDEIKKWETKITLLLAHSNDPRMFADIVCQKAFIFFLRWNWELILPKHSDYRAELNSDVVNVFQQELETGVSIYERLDLIPQKLRAQIWLAGFHFIRGRTNEFASIQRSVVSTANDFNLVGLAKDALNPIYVQGQELASADEDRDRRDASLDDATIELYARQRLGAFGLHEARFDNVRRAIEFLRDRAIEHLEWCEDLDLIESDGHLQSMETFYRKDPNRTAICRRHGYISNIDRPDWKTVSAEFKKRYCETCADRCPRQVN